MEKKKVLCWSDSPTAGTGFGVVSKNVIGALHKSGKYEIHQLAINFHGDFTDDQEVPWQIRPAKVLDPNDPHGIKMFMKVLQKNRYDIVWILNDLFVTHYLNDFIPKYKTACLKQNIKPPKFIYYYPVDCHVQNEVSEALDMVDIPVCYTKHGKQETLKKKPYLESRLVEIPHGVDSETFKPMSEVEIATWKRQYLNVGQDTFVVVAVNRNSTRKQLPYSVLAFKEFKKLVPNSIMYCHTQVVDQGSDMSRVLSDLGLSPQRDVVFPGRYSPSEPAPGFLLNQFYNCGDLFLTTHLGEGWGLSITEAMAAGVPVVAPNNTCYKPGTNVFLEDRIDSIENIKVGDKVLSINPETKNASYKEVTHVYELDHDGELIVIDTEQIKLSITPDHRVLHSDGRFSDTIIESKAENLTQSMYRLPCYGDMGNWNYDDYFYLPEPDFKQVHKKSQTHDRFHMDDFLSLLGWYISEGSIEKTGYRIRISQSKQENRKEILSLLDRMEINNHLSGDNICFNHNQLWQVFSSLGTTSQTKRLPRWVFTLHREQLVHLFNSMIKGDGHKCDIYTGYVTSSKALVRDFAELCMCMGYTFSIKEKKREDVVIKDRIIPKENQSVSWFIRVNNPKSFVQIRNCQGTQKSRKQDLKRVPYSGKVYCVTVKDNNNLFVGENGHFIFSGNCMSQQLGENSERGYMYECKDWAWIDHSGFRPKGLISDIVDQMLEVYKAGPKKNNPKVKEALSWAREHDWKQVTQKWLDLFERASSDAIQDQIVISEEV